MEKDVLRTSVELLHFDKSWGFRLQQCFDGSAVPLEVNNLLHPVADNIMVLSSNSFANKFQWPYSTTILTLGLLLLFPFGCLLQ